MDSINPEVSAAIESVAQDFQGLDDNESSLRSWKIGTDYNGGHELTRAVIGTPNGVWKLERVG